MLKFKDVKKCQNIQKLNEFIAKYLDENNLQGEQRKKTYWAPFYEWKEQTQESECPRFPH